MLACRDAALTIKFAGAYARRHSSSRTCHHPVLPIPTPRPASRADVVAVSSSTSTSSRQLTRHVVVGDRRPHGAFPGVRAVDSLMQTATPQNHRCRQGHIFMQAISDYIGCEPAGGAEIAAWTAPCNNNSAVISFAIRPANLKSTRDIGTPTTGRAAWWICAKDSRPRKPVERQQHLLALLSNPELR